MLAQVLELTQPQLDKQSIHQTNARRTSIQSLMKWRSAFVDTKIGGGLHNLGNSCFMNAVLQCLAYIPPLTQTLMAGWHSSRCKTNGFCLLCECEQLLPRLAAGTGDVLYPVAIYHNLSRVSDSLAAGHQEDAHEFLQNALVAMETTIDGDEKMADNQSRPNLIRDIFMGQTKSWTECRGCGNVTSQEEPFLCLSLDVEWTLHDAFADLCQEERMEGKDAFLCDNCQSRQTALRRTLVSELPPVLAVHLKRFRTSFNSNGVLETEKNGRHVSFPLDLDMSSQHLSKDVFLSDVSPRYELCGMIVHRGDNATSGHYYAIVRGCDGDWYRMDDNYVKRIPETEVFNQDAYILFYQSKDVYGVDNELDSDDDDDEDDDVSISEPSSVSVNDSDEDDGEKDEGDKWEGIDEWILEPMNWVNGDWY